MTPLFRSTPRASSLSSSFAAILAFAALLLLTSQPALAQIDAGSIVGTITDSQGGALPGASVVATQEGTGFAFTDTTNGRGQYSFPNLRIGRYVITAELSGFKKAVRSAVQLHVQERIQADFKLDVGVMTEEVTVSGEAPIINTQTADMGYSVDSK